MLIWTLFTQLQTLKLMMIISWWQQWHLHHCHIVTAAGYLDPTCPVIRSPGDRDEAVASRHDTPLLLLHPGLSPGDNLMHDAMCFVSRHSFLFSRSAWKDQFKANKANTAIPLLNACMWFKFWATCRERDYLSLASSSFDNLLSTSCWIMMNNEIWLAQKWRG